MRLITKGNGKFPNVTEAQLLDQLRRLDTNRNTFAILEREGEFYMQTAAHSNGFVLEKREGSEDERYHAVPTRAPPPRIEAPHGRGGRRYCSARAIWDLTTRRMRSRWTRSKPRS